jgi:hypothetical protein
LNRAFGDALQRGDLGHPEAAEELQVDDGGEFWFQRGQVVQRGADVRQLLRLGNVLGDLGVQRSDMHVAAALDGAAGPHLVDDAGPHGA